MASWGTSAYRKICGVDDLVVNSFALNLENDAIFSAPVDFNVKYDTTSEPMINSFQTQTGDSGVTLMNNDSGLDDGTFGFAFNKTAYTNVAWNEGDMMTMDVSVKALGSGINSTAIVEVAI